jgi:hypothetical protein
MPYLCYMVMSRKLVVRVSDQQLSSIRNSLLQEQDRGNTITKSALIRGILDEYFDQTCRKGGHQNYFIENKKKLDPAYSTRNKLKSNNIKLTYWDCPFNESIRKK